jgi:hypothetical protein
VYALAIGRFHHVVDKSTFLRSWNWTMVRARNFSFTGSAIAAITLSIFLSYQPRCNLREACASASPLENDKQAGSQKRPTSGVALHLSPQQGRPASVCREVLIRPNTAERELPVSPTLRELPTPSAGRPNLMYGFVLEDGSVAYEIEGINCGALGASLNSGSETPR